MSSSYLTYSLQMAYKQGHLFDKRHLLERGVYLKMPILEGHLLDMRRLLESGHLKHHLRFYEALGNIATVNLHFKYGLFPRAS